MKDNFWLQERRVGVTSFHHSGRAFKDDEAEEVWSNSKEE